MSAIVGWPNWIGVVAEDVEKQRAFYRDVLGFREIDQGEGWVWLDLGWPVLFEILSLDPSLPQYDGRRYQVGLATGEIDRTFENLRARGVEVVTKPQGGEGSASQWAYFRDVEGNMFEISQCDGPSWPGDRGGSSHAVVGPPVWTGIISRDLEKMSSWVRDTLGLRPLQSSDWWSWFDCGWPNLFEVIRRDPRRPQYEQPGWQVAYAVGDIRRAREELIRRGARPLNEVDGGPEFAGYWCDFHDAEGNVFGITQRLGPPWPGETKES